MLFHIHKPFFLFFIILQLIQMLQALKQLTKYLSQNNLTKTLQELRYQLISQIPQQPSIQFLNTIKNIQLNSLEKQFIISKRKKYNQDIQQNNEKQQDIMNQLINKIAFNSNLLNNSKINKKVQKIMDKKVFLKLVQNTDILFQNKGMQENKLSELQESNRHDDLIQFIIAPKIQKQFSKQANLKESDRHQFSFDNNISFTQSINETIIKNNRQLQQEYQNDLDFGYFAYMIKSEKYFKITADIASKFNYPECAIKKSENSLSNQLLKNNQNKKCSTPIKFPKKDGKMYTNYNGITYNAWSLKVIYNRQKTGYEDTKDYPIIEGQVIGGRFKIIKQIGSGAFAKVLKVLDIKQKKYKSLKLIANQKQYFDQALDEVRILQLIKLNCDTDKNYLINFQTSFYHKEHLFIQTELLKQNLLNIYKTKKKFFTLPKIKIIAKQCLIALSQLHKLQIIHCDLKPENILIKSQDPLIVKIIDLGNSNFFQDQMGNYIQSRSYRAPEVILGLPCNQKIDIWSLGCILAELWTQNLLFPGLHIQGMIARIQSILGPWPEWMLKQGTLTRNYFNDYLQIFLQQKDRIQIFIPKKTNLKNRLRCEDKIFEDFIEGLIKLDPRLRLTSQQALKHRFLN